MADKARRPSGRDNPNFSEEARPKLSRWHSTGNHSHHTTLERKISIGNHGNGNHGNHSTLERKISSQSTGHHGDHGALERKISTQTIAHGHHGHHGHHSHHGHHHSTLERKISTQSIAIGHHGHGKERKISTHSRAAGKSHKRTWSSVVETKLKKVEKREPLNLMETTDTEIQELFGLMDVNKDQKLAPKELDCILRALGINATEADLIEFIGELPTEGGDKDSVTYHQFAESIKNNMALTNETDSLQVTFNAFDHAGDGFIDGDKLKSVLSNLGLQFQEGDLHAILSQIGHDGRISFDEFQQFMLNSEENI